MPKRAGNICTIDVFLHKNGVWTLISFIHTPQIIDIKASATTAPVRAILRQVRLPS
jgi:hypothetical protein